MKLVSAASASTQTLATPWQCRIPPLLAVPAACAALLTPAAAFAQETGAAVAEALFRTGRALMAAGDAARACPKFAESNRLDPKLGTLLNLALCHETVGLKASAWAEYNEAATIAGRAGQSERERVARAITPHRSRAASRTSSSTRTRLQAPR